MIGTNATITTDEEVDYYINGKLSEAQEIDFEARYLEDPELLQKVELAQRLKEEFAAANTAGLLHQKIQPVAGSRFQKLIDYFAIPQTAFGALAALLLITPMVLLTQPQSAKVAIDSELVMIAHPEIRSADSSNNTNQQPLLTLDVAAPWVTLAFEVPPSLGRPITWQLSITRETGEQVFQGEPQYPNGRSIISVTINTQAFISGDYRYVITPEKSSEKLPLHGRIRVL